jgi:acetyl-CoA carboxylase biotin carboxylase subunit
VRVDSGLYEGIEISLYYDPLIAKLLTWGNDRNEAIERMKRALSEYRISGVATTIPFHIKVMNNEKFKEGKIHTHFIEEEMEKGQLAVGQDSDDIFKAVAVFSALLDYQEKKGIRTPFSKPKSRENPWKIEGRRMGLRQFG